MKAQWPQYAIIRVASFVAPRDQRAEWLQAWQSEVWYVPRSEATRLVLGAFRDALWVRRNVSDSAESSPVKRTGTHLESPLSCLAFLSALAAVSLLIAICLSVPLRELPMYSHLRLSDLPIGCVLTLGLSCLLLPGALACRPSASRHPRPAQNRLRRGMFLALKIALVQPTMLCLCIVWVLTPGAPLAGAGCILILRWVFKDQRQRCPVCLRALTSPVRIGDPSKTFLEWYGAESTCSRGHGLLQVSEISSSYSPDARWLRLDDSWGGLFPAVRGRQS